MLYTPLEGEERIEAEIWREKLLEEIAELDDDFLEKYFNKTYGIEDIKESIRKIAIANCLSPQAWQSPGSRMVLIPPGIY